MFTLAATQDTPRGWGGPIALLVAVAIFIAIATLHDAWQRSRETPSPTPGDGRGVRVKPQVSSVSDTADTEPDTGWWGRIVTVDGRRVRQVDSAAVDGELDLDLDDPEEAETIEDVIARMDDQGVPYMEIVRHLIDEFEVSESTAKRSIRDVRAERRSTV